MSIDHGVKQASCGDRAARVCLAVLLGSMVMLGLWISAFNLATSFVVGSGAIAIILVASSTSDLFEQVLDAIASAVLAVVGAIAALLGALLGIIGV